MVTMPFTTQQRESCRAKNKARTLGEEAGARMSACLSFYGNRKDDDEEGRGGEKEEEEDHATGRQPRAQCSAQGEVAAMVMAMR